MQEVEAFHYADHIRLWDSVIDLLKEWDPDENWYEDGEEVKYFAFKSEFKNMPAPEYHCFACQYALDRLDDDDADPDTRCQYCPLDWSIVSGKNECCSTDEYGQWNGLYDQYMDAVDDEDLDLAIEIAEQIRDCPIKEGIKIA